LTAAIGLSVRNLMRTIGLMAAGRRPASWSLSLALGVPVVDPGADALVTLSRRKRLPVAALAAGTVLLAAACARALALHWAHGPVLNLVAATLLGVAFADLFPLGRTAAGEFFTAFIGGNEPFRDALTYLRTKLLKRLAALKLFPGEAAIVAFIAWLSLWAVLAFNAGTELIAGNQAALVAGLSVRGDPLATAVTWLMLAGIGLFLLTAAGGLLSLAAGAAASLVPKRRAGYRTRQAGPLDAAQVGEALKRIPFFALQPAETLAGIAESARQIRFEKNAVLIRQGDYGDEFFALTEGRAAVVIEEDSGRQRQVAVVGEGDGFGEIALVESVPRTATVRALTPGRALVIGREPFMEAVPAEPQRDIISLIRGANVLKGSSVFSGLAPEAMAGLLRRFERITIKPGQTVIRRGEAGQYFYVVLEGELEVLDRDDKTPIARLAKGDPFGEIALLANAPRTATVVAVSGGSLLMLDKDSFNEFFAEHLTLGERLESLGAERRARLKERADG
ncbi:MAG: cyclic nucleotide-binding domain-containing protein, partial [Candidatus Edwardsbacteria bacterium]|nr:cyclic nucleotide-binding domain-containing protein [Candidatus Edwardsbacteria bacterium]